jgi:hypothetical protein
MLLLNQVSKEFYAELSEDTIVSVIKESEERITDRIINAYREEAASDSFTLNESVLKLRKLNNLYLPFIAEKYYFVLDDHSTVLVSESTIRKLNALNLDKEQLVEYMQKSQDNFRKIIEKLQEE